jgi:hypothetical protein
MRRRRSARTDPSARRAEVVMVRRWRPKGGSRCPASTASDSEWSGSCRPTGQKASRTLSVPITISTPRAASSCSRVRPAPVGRAVRAALQVEVRRRQRGHGDPAAGPACRRSAPRHRRCARRGCRHGRRGPAPRSRIASATSAISSNPSSRGPALRRRGNRAQAEPVGQRKEIAQPLAPVVVQQETAQARRRYPRRRAPPPARGRGRSSRRWR